MMNSYYRPYLQPTTPQPYDPNMFNGMYVPQQPAYQQQPVQQNIQQPVFQQTQQQQQNKPNNEFASVNGFGFADGINAAKAMNIPNGSSWIFFDVKNQLFYIKTVGPNGMPEPMYIASYKQISEDELNKLVNGQTDMSDYVKKEDINMDQYATKADIAKLLDIIEQPTDYVKNGELEDRIVQIMQEKMSTVKPQRKIKETE